MLGLVRWCAIICAVLGAQGLGHAQAPSSYPDRPIRLVVAFPPGGATDTLTRQLTHELGEALGQSVVIENKPGAGGYIAWNYVADSPPDGYTLLMAENAIGISQALHKKATSPFDPLRQYDAIATVATSPLVLAAANNVNVNSVAELIAYSRTVPQKMNYASAGIGTVGHLTFEVFRVASGIEAVHVPYKGGGPAMNDVVAGHVALNMAAIQVAKGLVETGKIKGLAVTGAKRSPVLPNVPTLQEAGVKTADVDLGFWSASSVPRAFRTRSRPSWTRRSRRRSRIRACASAWPSSTSSRPTRRAVPCGRSSRTRSRTGPSSSMRTASSRNEIMRDLFRCCAVACVVLGATGSAPAQSPSSYPDRPIRLVVAFVAGGATDTLARQISNDLKEALGQSVVVENRPEQRLSRVEPCRDVGAGRLHAAARGKRARHQPGAAQEGDLELRSLDAVRRHRRDRDLALGAGRRQQRPRQYGGGACCTLAHGAGEDELCVRRRRQCLASELRGVQGRRRNGSHPHPLQGGGQAIGDVIAGHVPMTISSVQATKSVVEAGRVKALAVTSPARSPALPNVPTMKRPA